MESEWRQKGEHELTRSQLETKRRMDDEWKAGCDLRGRAFYLNADGSRRQYTTEELEVFQTEENRLWDAFMAQSIASGLYEEITIEEQITRAREQLEADTARLGVLTAAKAERDREIMLGKDIIKDTDIKDIVIGGKGS